MKPISWYKSLSGPRERRQTGCFLVEGERGVGQLLSYHRGHIAELLCVDGAAHALNASGIPIAACQSGQLSVDGAAGIPVRAVSPANMKSICTSRTPQGVAAVVRMPADVYTPSIPDPSPDCHKGENTLARSRISPPGCRVLLLEDVQDPGNAGTLIRTAAAFGYGGVIMSDKCADPFSPKVVRSTAGSLLSLWIRRNGAYIDMAAELGARGCELIAADLGGEEARGPVSAGSHVLALGSEGAGLSAAMLDICDRRIRIPMAASGAESLNVAVSGGIVMFMVSGGAV